MLIEDHINLLPDNPLRGRNLDDFGPRFPDMSQPYSNYLNNKLLEIAKREGIILHKGVYASIMGLILKHAQNTGCTEILQMPLACRQFLRLL